MNGQASSKDAPQEISSDFDMSVVDDESEDVVCSKH